MTAADELVPLPAGPYRPPPPQAERMCPGCHVDLMRARHDDACPNRPQVDDVMRLATTLADARAEAALVRCHRRAVKAWLKSGRSL